MHSASCVERKNIIFPNPLTLLLYTGGGVRWSWRQRIKHALCFVWFDTCCASGVCMNLPLHVCGLNKTVTCQQTNMEDREMWQQKLDKQVSANFTIFLHLDHFILTTLQTNLYFILILICSLLEYQHQINNKYYQCVCDHLFQFNLQKIHQFWFVYYSLLLICIMKLFSPAGLRY